MKGKTIIIVTAVLSVIFLTICTYQFLKRRGQLLSGKKRAGDEEDKTVVIEQQSISVVNDQSIKPNDLTGRVSNAGDNSVQHNSSKTHLRGHARGFSMDSNFSNTSASPMFNASMTVSNVIAEQQNAPTTYATPEKGTTHTALPIDSPFESPAGTPMTSARGPIVEVDEDDELTKKPRPLRSAR